jgi:hypothetical protein
MADPKAEVPKKKRSPKAGKRITVTLSDEHYEKVTAAAADDDREPNAWLTRYVRRHLDDTTIGIK